MESVLAGFILVFLLLFGTLSFSQVFMTAQEQLRAGWQSVSTRIYDQTHTGLAAAETQITDGGSQVRLTLNVTGETRFIDFDRWDVIVQYDDNSQPAVRRIAYLPYTTTAPVSNQWTLAGLYMNASAGMPEVFEPEILNPGEQAQLTLQLNPPVGEGGAVQVVIGLATGGRASSMAVRNVIPVLAVNTGLILNAGQTVIINSAYLQTTDRDGNPANLTYTVITPPAQGVLSLPALFTQAQIDAGLLTYAHAGSGSDSFQFTVSDGQDIIGVYSFVITQA